MGGVDRKEKKTHVATNLKIKKKQEKQNVKRSLQLVAAAQLSLAY